MSRPRPWLGEEFGFIDPSRIGDGQDDTLPVSTALCRALWSNTMWLATEPRVVAWSPIVDAADDLTTQEGTRPYAFLEDWVSVWRGKIEIKAGARELQIWGAWYALTATATDGGVNDETQVSIRVAVEGVDTTIVELDQTRDPDTWANVLLGRDRISVDLANPPPGVYYVDVSMRSTKGKTLGSGSDGVRLEGLRIEDANSSPTLFVDSAAGNPDDDSLEVMSLSAGYGETADFDLVGSIDRSSKDPGTSAAHLFTRSEISVSDNSATLRELSFLAPRAFALRVRYDRTSVARILPDELRPNIILTGGATTRAAVALRDLLVRPRLVGLGHRGTLSSSDSAYTDLGYRRGWSRMFGEAAETALWSESVYLTTDRPTLRIHQVLALLSLDTAGAEGKRAKRTPGGLRGKRASVDRSGLAAWDFRVVVEQLVDVPGGNTDWPGSRTEFGEGDATRVLDIQPAKVTMIGPPVVRSMTHIFTSSAYSSFAYREGQWIIDGGDVGGDFETIQELSIDVSIADVGGVAIDTAKLVRVTLYAEHDTAHAANSYLRLDDASPTIGPEGWLQLIAGESSITEVPEPSEVLGDLRIEHFLSGANIETEDWEAIRERIAWHWSRTGAMFAGPVFDPPWQTTSTTLTTVDEGAGDIDLDTWAGAAVLERLTPDDYVAASGTLEPTANASDGDEVVIGAKTYTMQTTLTDVDGHVAIGADIDESLNNLRAAINLDAGAGTKYAASMTEHPDVGADAFSQGGVDWLLVTADEEGRDGNAIATTTTWTSSDWDDPTLTGGSEGTYILEFCAYLQDAELTISWKRFDDRLTVGKSGTVTLSSSSGDSEWVTATLELDEAEAYEGDTTEGELAVFYFHLAGKTTGTTGYMWQPGGREQQVDPESFISVAAEFGTSASLSAGPTQYFAAGGGADQDVIACDAVGLSGQCAIGRDDGSIDVPPIKLIPDDGGAAVWDMDTSGMRSTIGRIGGVRSSADAIYCLVSSNSSGNMLAKRLDISDGSEVWATAFSSTSQPSGFKAATCHVAGEGKYFVSVNDSADEIRMLNASDGTDEGDTNDATTNGGPGSSGIVGVMEDESYLLVAGKATERVSGLSLPFSDGDAFDWSIDFKGGVDTTLTWSVWNNTTSPVIQRDRVGSGAWICGGIWTANEAYLMHMVASDGSGSVDIEIDVSGDMDITSDEDYVADICVDKYGHVYALVINSTFNPDADIVRYDPDGNFVYSFKASGATLPVSADAVVALSIAVDEEGTVYLGDDDGYVWVYTQS